MNENEKTDQENDELNEALINAFKFRGAAEQVLRDVKDVRLKAIKKDNRGLKRQNKALREDSLKIQRQLSKVIDDHNAYLHANNLESVARATLIFTMQTRIFKLENELKNDKAIIRTLKKNIEANKK